MSKQPDISQAWRALPDCHAQVISKGKWKPWPYLTLISDEIVAARANGGGSIIVNIPPRYGKSEFVSYHVPLWFLDAHPTERVILTTHTADLSESYGKRVRNEANMNPELLFKVAADSSAAGSWQTSVGGGMESVGIGGSIVGKGGNLIIVDDTIKSWAEADSEANQKSQIEWFRTTLWTRREPGCVLIILMTRWHKKDLVGYLTSSELQSELKTKFKHIVIPAIAEDNDPIGRKPGEPLCPERFSLDDLHDQQVILSNHQFQALYQQKPTEAGEGIYKSMWTRMFTEKPKNFTTLITTDSAFSMKKTADYSVIMTTLTDEYDNLYCWEYARGRISIQSFINAIFDSVKRSMNLQKCIVEIPVNESEDNSAIIMLIREEMAKRGVYFVLEGLKPQGDKVSRAQKLIGMAGNGKFFIREGQRELLNELTDFPFGDHDDLIDTLSLASLHMVRADGGKDAYTPKRPQSWMSS